MQKSKSRKSNSGLVVVIVILILIIITAGALYYFKYFYAEERKHVGNWARQADVTDYVTESMAKWLADASLANSVNYGDAKASIKVKLNVSGDGKYVETFDDASYEAAKNAAKEVAIVGLTSFLENRLEAAGVSGEKTGKTVDELIQESIGMSVSDYLDNYGPELLPPSDVLREKILINGTYTVDGDVIVIVTKGRTTAIDFIAADGYFILSEETENPSPLGTPINTGIDEEIKPLFNYPVIYGKGKNID